MRTIVLAAAKGGVGKSTLTMGLAVAAILSNPTLRVGLVDLDPQGSLTAWWNSRERSSLELFERGKQEIAVIQDYLASAGFDLVFFDCPPGFNTVLREAISVADLVLVPTGASVLDLMAVSSTAQMAQQVGVPYHFVLSRVSFRTRITGDAIKLLRDNNVMTLPIVYQRVLVATAMATGHTALEIDPNSEAGKEQAALWRAVQAQLASLPMRSPCHSGKGAQP